MEKEKALELLDLDASATAQEIRSAYQEMYNELQIRITNAPTDHQRKLYNRRLKELEEAYGVLGHSTAEDTGELPNIGPVEMQLPSEKPAERSGETETEALDKLGLQNPFTTSLLENAFRKKKRELETARLESPIDSIKEFYTTEIGKLGQAYTYLKPLAEDASRGKATDKRPGTRNLIFLVLAIGIIGTGSFLWLSWEQSSELDPAQREHFIALKSQGDLLAGQQQWTTALEKYRSADEVIEDREVQDSISSIESRLLSIEKENAEKARLAEEKVWEEATKLKTVTAYESYLAAYPEGKYAETAQKEISALKKAERAKNMIGTKELHGLKDSDGDEFHYKGQTKADLPHGSGVANFTNGDKYSGNWHAGNRHGQGTFTWENGSTYHGEWKDDKRHGNGTCTYSDGDIYVGEYKNGERHGNGAYTYSNGGTYVGGYKNGQRHGNGTYTFSSGKKYIGEFRDGDFHGYGKQYASDGSIIFEGEWINDEPQQ